MAFDKYEIKKLEAMFAKQRHDIRSDVLSDNKSLIQKELQTINEKFLDSN